MQVALFPFYATLHHMQNYVVIEKKVGETPLQCIHAYKEKHPELASVSITYAGRLDPLASGKLLLLIGETCKQKEHYLKLDKQYEFEVLFGVSSDTADVLGRLSFESPLLIDRRIIRDTLDAMCGTLTLPYPHFSSKTVQGKPLHTWALEGRIDEVTVPTRTCTVYTLTCIDTYTRTRKEIYGQALEKIDSITTVTDSKKSLGNDFRRSDIRTDWKMFLAEGTEHDLFQLARIRCIASSGTYMRTLASVLAARCGTQGLAFSIHRSKIGRYLTLPLIGGLWMQSYD